MDALVIEAVTRGLELLAFRCLDHQGAQAPRPWAEHAADLELLVKLVQAWTLIQVGTGRQVDLLRQAGYEPSLVPATVVDEDGAQRAAGAGRS